MRYSGQDSNGSEKSSSPLSPSAPNTASRSLRTKEADNSQKTPNAFVQMEYDKCGVSFMIARTTIGILKYAILDLTASTNYLKYEN